MPAATTAAPRQIGSGSQALMSGSSQNAASAAGDESEDRAEAREQSAPKPGDECHDEDHDDHHVDDQHPAPSFVRRKAKRSGCGFARVDARFAFWSK